MLNISLCVTIKSRINSKSCTTFTTDVQNVRRLQRHKHGSAYAIFTPFSMMGTSSPRARDSKPRAAEMRDAGFHTSVSVAAQQSGIGSKSCGRYGMGCAPAANLQGEYPDCGGVAAAHYRGVGTPRPACHRQRSEAVA